MATPKENSHRIQEYLDGEMPDADRYQFEQDCAKDKSLAADLALYQSVQQSLSDQEALAFRRKVAERIAQNESLAGAVPKAGRHNGRNLLLLLAALAVVAVGLFLYRRSGDSSTPKEAEEQLNTPIPSLPSNEVDTTSALIAKTADVDAPSSDLQEARATETAPLPPPQEVSKAQVSQASAYRQLALSEYKASTFLFRGLTANTESVDSSEQALRLFAQASATTDSSVRQNYLKQAIGLLDSKRATEDERLVLTRAQAHFQMGQYARATADFTALQNSFIYGSDADWGLVLCYLAQLPAKAADYEQAIGLILEDKSHSFHPKAIALQERVEALR